MTYNAERYTYRVMWSEEDAEFVGLCLEMPSLSWLATSQGEALNGITRVVADVLKDMAKSGEPAPQPISAKKHRGKMLVRVPPELHRELEMEAAEQKVSVNRLISMKLAR